MSAVGLQPSRTADILVRHKDGCKLTFYNFEEDYVRRLREGDPFVQQHFYSYFRELLTIKLWARRLRDPELAADIIQTTFVRVLDAVQRGSIEHPERFGSYVNSVADIVRLEEIRKQSRYQGTDDDAPQPADPRADPLEVLIDEERKGQVRDLLGQLSPDERHLIRAVVYEERNRDEVAKEMGVTPDYLRVLLHRAIRHLLRDHRRRYGATA